MEERAKAFIERNKKEPDWVLVTVLRFAQARKKGLKRERLALRLLETISKRSSCFAK
jgi:hypothetical protein